MRGKRLRKKGLQGSYTVEAALLMLVILPILIAILLAGFYVHDLGKLQGNACEIAAAGACLRDRQGAEAILRERAQKLSSASLIWAKDPEASVSVGEKQIAVQFSGSFRVPGFVGGVWSAQSGRLQAGCTRRIYAPARMIRKLKGAAHVAELLS